MDEGYLKNLYMEYMEQNQSDIVVYMGYDGYINLSTGASSDFMSSVVSGRRHLVFSAEDLPNDGFVAIMKDDILALYDLHITFDMDARDASWEIRDYAYILKNSDGRYECHGFGDFQILSDSSDACGQYVCSVHKNIPALSIFNALHFFGGTFVVGKTPYRMMDGGLFFSYLCNITRYGKDNRFSFLFNPNDIDMERGIPGEAYNAAMSYIDEHYTMNNPSLADIELVKKFCILDDNGGEPVARFYIVAYLPGSGTKSRMEKVEFFEYMRMSMHHMKHMEVSSLNVTLVWVHSAIKSYFKYLPDIPMKLYEFIFISTNDLLEGIYKYSSSMWDEVVENYPSVSIGTAASDIFGVIYDRKKLHQKLGIPKSMLCMLNNRINSCKMIRMIKILFCSCPEYLQNMNESDISSIMDIHPFPSETCMEACSILVRLYGPSQHMGYIRFVNNNHGRLQKNILDYYNILSMLDDGTRKLFRWDVSESELYIMSELASEVLQNDENKDTRFMAFERMKKEWKRYEYQSGRFIITCPDTPLDLVHEGNELRHCVSSFIDACAEGVSLILFIRRAEAPCEPYYTLEIREGCIRQCHGFANKVIRESYDYPALSSFLKGFCEKTGIRYTEGSEMLGAGY